MPPWRTNVTPGFANYDTTTAGTVTINNGTQYNVNQHWLDFNNMLTANTADTGPVTATDRNKYNAAIKAARDWMNSTARSISVSNAFSRALRLVHVRVEESTRSEPEYHFELDYLGSTIMIEAYGTDAYNRICNIVKDGTITDLCDYLKENNGCVRCCVEWNVVLNEHMTDILFGGREQDVDKEVWKSLFDATSAR